METIHDQKDSKLALRSEYGSPEGIININLVAQDKLPDWMRRFVSIVIFSLALSMPCLHSLDAISISKARCHRARRAYILYSAS